MSLEDNFSKSIECFNIKPTHKIAVGVSGGSDSLALTLLVSSWAKTPIVAITVDHKLRKESELEAQQTTRWLAKYGIEHHILNWEGEKPESNIQSHARDARYNLMTGFCKSNKIRTLLIAHNKEDQAENLLIRLMRGSGLEGLCGMKQEININEIRILRPLLETRKEDLKSFLRSKRQGWIEDPSNENDKFTRVQVRNFINSQPEPELLVNRLVNTCNNLQKSNNYIENKIAQEMEEVAILKDEGYYVLDINNFKSLHEESAIKILSKIIKFISGEYYKPRFEKLENIYKGILNEEYNVTLGGCELFQSKKQNESNKLLIIKEKSKIQEKKSFSNQSKLTWDKRFSCEITVPLSNDYFVGAITPESLSRLIKQNKKLEDIKLPKKIIYTIPALQTLEKIVAAPHIYHYDNEEFENVFKVSLLR